ncbi:NUDIX domain-containing protein [Siculibacillus lacustris]|uniref:NUDIX domain-containing protein n=1 Tax=Siculibacillus lacustris TaxID=1549641 RepID=A0A4Q9VH52_9HYPH|nr:NUDIX domain-containing protein [Siculibacillus lacustris]TBW34426.1 NUDIX domain-containing protein [Siculibacillus lacustris]
MDIPESRLRRGVSVCVFRGDRVLMIRRGKAPGIGLWAPVGGGIEAGESARDAALRETLEETGVTARIVGVSGRRLILRRDDDGLLGVDLIVHAAAWVAGEPVAGDDAAEARFVTDADLSRLDLMPGVLPFIRVARRLHDGQGPVGSVMQGASGSGAGDRDEGGG